MKYITVFFLALAGLFAGEGDFRPGRAFALLEEQVEFGPRVPGTEEHAACRDWIAAYAAGYADTVILQAFSAYRPVTKDTVTAWNIIARFRPGKSRRVMLSTHWDTRPVADRDPLYPERPVPGANDGASGTAVLLELLAYVRDLPSRAGVDVIFWDAEDMGIAGTGAYFCQGSEYYARHPLAPAPQKGILIDMIGDHDLRIPVEVFSMQYAPGLVREVWDIAGKWGYRQIFPRRVEYEVMDDHVPLNRIAGIRTINLIDFHYTLRGRNIWHTTDDLPAYCSPESLRIVADVLMSWLSDL